jgi:hypothetical protein
VAWICKYNKIPAHLCPRLRIRVEEIPDPKEAMALLKDAAASNIPVDADKAAEMIGVPVIPNETGKPRRMVPLSPVKIDADGEIAPAAPAAAPDAPDDPEAPTPDDKPGKGQPDPGTGEADDDEQPDDQAD